MAEVVINISGMHCQGCVGNVRGILAGLPGVTCCEVVLEPGKAEVTYDPAVVTPAALCTAIEDAGFDAEAVQS